MEYIREIDTHYTKINHNIYGNSLISILTSINQEFWDNVVYYSTLPTEEKLNKVKTLIENVIRKFNFKRKRLMKNVACLVPRLQRKFAKDPKKMMSSGYYGREMTLEEQEAKLQARLDAQSRNDQDPLLALLHDKEFDYDYESDSMGKANIVSTVWKLYDFSIT